MSDRDLMELVTKAHGKCKYFNDAWRCAETGYREFNPIDDDGDNRRLANKLELSMVFAEENDCCWVTVFGAPYAWYDQIDAVQEAYPVSRAGQDAAVRRAVVRAAAEIGRNMP